MPIHKISRVLSLQTGLSDWVLNQAENSCSRFAEPGYRTVEESTANPLHLSCLCCDSGEWIGGLWLSMHWDDWLICFLIWDIECESNLTKPLHSTDPEIFGLWTEEIALVRDDSQRPRARPVEFSIESISTRYYHFSTSLALYIKGTPAAWVVILQCSPWIFILLDLWDVFFNRKYVLSSKLLPRLGRCRFWWWLQQCFRSAGGRPPHFFHRRSLRCGSERWLCDHLGQSRIWRWRNVTPWLRNI